MIGRELAFLWRIPHLRFALLAFSALLLFACWQSARYLASEAKVIADTTALMQKTTQELRNRFADRGDAGEAAYYRFELVYQPPGPWAVLNTNQRRTQVQLQRIRMLGLQGQLYEQENRNPEAQVIGAIDPAFVLVFILPLLAMALGFDLYANERDSGRLGLLLSLSATAQRFWLARLAVRALLLILACALPFLLMAHSFSWPLLDLALLVLIVAAYSCFWLLLSAAVGLLGRSALLSALVNLALWVGLLVIMPQLWQSYAALRYPASAGASLALAHRKAVNDAWDLPKAVTLEPFTERYPEYRNTPPVLVRFHWKWYYAFHDNADVAVQPLALLYRQQHQARDQLLRNSALLNPAIALQSWLLDRSGQSLQDVFAQQDRIADFHRQWREYHYPLVFNEIPLSPASFDAAPGFTPKIAIGRNNLAMHCALAVSTGVAFLLLLWSLRHRQKAGW